MTDKRSHLNQPENRNKIEKSSILRQRRTTKSVRTGEAQTPQREKLGEGQLTSAATLLGSFADSGHWPETDHFGP